MKKEIKHIPKAIAPKRDNTVLSNLWKCIAQETF